MGQRDGLVVIRGGGGAGERLWVRVVGSTRVGTGVSYQCATGLYTARTEYGEDGGQGLGSGSWEDHRQGGHDESMLKTFPPNLGGFSGE